jgi:hypothetical protein
MALVPLAVFLDASKHICNGSIAPRFRQWRLILSLLPKMALVDHSPSPSLSQIGVKLRCSAKLGHAELFLK